MNQFPSIRKLDQAILYSLELASSLSVLLLAFGLIASMANVLTKGSVLSDNLVMQRVWARYLYKSTTTDAEAKKGGLNQAEALLPLTVPEVRKLLWKLVWGTNSQLMHVLHWSDFRRCKQARTKRSHYKKRLKALAA